MRVSKDRQMLTTGIVDANRNQIPPDTIDWTEFDKNPILLYNPETEGHRGVVVGQVIDRERTGDGFSARLAFVENVAEAETAYQKYVQGALPYVSIGGFAAGHYDEENDVFIAEQYLIKEVSLVKIPANLEARKIETKQVAASDAWFVEGREELGQEVRYIEMSSELHVEAETETVEEVNASAETKTEEEVNASAETETVEEVIESAETETVEEVTASAETETKKELNANATKMPKGMTWHEHSKQTINNSLYFMEKTFKQLNCDADFQKRMSVLNAGLRTGAKAADNTPENAETIKVLASAMLQDEKMVIIASATNFTNKVTNTRTNGLKFLCECAAGGAAAATLAAADLGVIKWLSLFYERLLPDNTFMRSLRFVPMSDREGAIYVESGINPATYVGAVTPVNAPRYMYDDIKRTIARQVFAIQPVTFQNADMAILAYDKQSWGWRIAMDSLMSDVATYILQVAANTAGVAKVGTSGEAFSTEGQFPIEAPNSRLNVKSVAPKDLLNAQGEFLKQNYRLNDRNVEIVLPSVLFSKLAAEPQFLSNLTRDLEGTIKNELRFMGNRIAPRNPVARVNTANGQPELDPSLYADGSVNSETGAITSIEPAVTTAQHVGAGLAFVENEIIAGIGTIDVIIAPDPENYGVTMSGWMSAGATVARQDGKGVALIVPTIEG